MKPNMGNAHCGRELMPPPPAAATGRPSPEVSRFRRRELSKLLELELVLALVLALVLVLVLVWSRSVTVHKPLQVMTEHYADDKVRSGGCAALSEAVTQSAEPLTAGRRVARQHAHAH